MTVANVWGRIEGVDVLPSSSDGDEWGFDLPGGLSGTFVAEFWAEDLAGNIGYRAAMLTLEAGSIKCLRWLETGSVRMLAPRRPVLEALSLRRASVLPAAPEVLMEPRRALCRMLPHACPRSET